MFRLGKCGIVAVAVAACVHSALATPLRVYEIGNSLTADVFQNGGFEQLVIAGGRQVQQGHTIRWGMGLITQWNDYVNQTQDPHVTSVQGGFFQDALTQNPYDVITLQPFANSLTDEMFAARQMIDIARAGGQNANARIYLYAPWPGLAFNTNSTVFDSLWKLPYADATQPVGNFPSQDFFLQCFQTLRADYADNEVNLIPTGEVFADLSARIRAGEVPGISLDTELYNDSLHASLQLGRFVAAASWYTAMFGQDPHGVSVPAVYSPIVTPEIAEVVYDSIWTVFTTQALQTGVWAPGDLTGEAAVNFDDLLILAQHFGTVEGATRTQGDLTGDGVVDFDDLLLLAQHYNSSAEPDNLAAQLDSVADEVFAEEWAFARSFVPEPIVATPILLAGAGLRRSRR